MKRLLLLLVVVWLVPALVATLHHLCCGFDRLAGFPYGLDDLEGGWALHHVTGRFDVPPPRRLRFGPADTPDRILLLVDGGSWPFELRGLGELVFADGTTVDPLVRDGEAHVMTHRCPTEPAWDHLVVFPDGPPLGRDPTRRAVVYERD